jgi:hypothetical protein
MKARPKKKPVSRETDRSKWTPEQIGARKKELLEKDAEWAEKEKQYMEQNKIEFFKPIDPYQTKILEHLHSGKKVISLTGGNGIGKTTLGAVIVGSACLGIQPWDKADTAWGNRPVKVRILCADWEKHAATVIVPKLKEWLPVGQYTTSKNNVGVESFWTFKTGSTLEIITNKQATTDHEGWEGDFVWADEEFDRDKFVANLRGLRRPEDKGGMGIFLMTQTAVRQAWMLDDVIRNPHPSYASVTEIPQDANPYLTQEYKEIFRASLKENEKIARIDGKWLVLAGLVWRFNADVHLIDDFELPTDWPVVPMIDFHPALPQAIAFFATDPVGFHYAIKQVWKHLSPEATADVIIRAKMGGWRIEDVFIDPLSKGDTAYVKNRFGDVPDSFSVIKDRLSGHGITLHVATKDKSSGILNVEKMLQGPNGRPVLFFFRTLIDSVHEEGLVWEIQRWNYDENNKPRDENDHFMENLYRYSLVGNKYSEPAYRRGELKSEIDFDPYTYDKGERRAEL